MECVDDLIVEVMGLVGAGSRLQLGIVASSKGMIGGGMIDQFELSEFCDHLPLPSTPEKQEALLNNMIGSELRYFVVVEKDTVFQRIQSMPWFR